MQGVYFPTPDEGWAVGGNGGDGWVIHYSGGQWKFDTVPDLNTSWLLTDVCFPSGGQGWAVGVDWTGPKGVILRYSLLEVTSPDKEDEWQRGKTYPIRWTYSGNPGASVKIELYKMGIKDSTIAEGVSIGSGGSGLYNWKIPSKQETGWGYQVRVTVEGNGLYTDLSPRFAIVKTAVAPNIFLKSPDGGESWKAGTARTIKWEYSGNCGSKVKIDLLKDGNLDSVIADNVSIGIGGIKGGEGSFTWNIPSTQHAGDKYKVRVSSKTKKTCSDTSTKNFRITNSALSPEITVIAPNGGEHWQVGTAQTIQWSFTGNPGSLKIELLKGGIVHGTIATDVTTGKDGKGQYAWSIPSTQATGGDYRIRVTSQLIDAVSDTSNYDFVLNPNTKGPTISVTTPNGGESWQADTTHTIQWTYTGNPGSTVKIDAYRITGTALAHFPIVGSTPVGSGGTGSYSWKIPADQPAGSDYKIAVTSTTVSSCTDMSDNNFTITAGSSGPTITVTSANGGETMQAGWTGYMMPNIQWKYTGNPGPSVRIELLKGGVFDSVIAASVPVGSGGSGSHYWDIPVSQPAGTDYRIRITSTTNSAYTDTGDGNFTILAAPTLAVISPNGGESWQSGSTYTVSWTYGGSLFSAPFNSIDIELLKGGTFNSVIATNVPVTNGSYSWSIPGGQVPGSDYRVRLTYKFYSQISDSSNGNFTIAGCFSPAGISVVTPNGGESWLRGISHTIQWSYVGCPGTNVKIELISNFPGTVAITSTIVDSTPIGTGGSGSYSWAIPAGQPTGTNVYKVKVTTNLGYSDTSDGYFAIWAAIIGPTN
jgi:5-hydroxyisourate hydrolase-like protein (transthyretin family)